MTGDKKSTTLKETLDVLADTKVYAKKWKGKYSLYFKEEFESYPEVREAIEKAFQQSTLNRIEEIDREIDKQLARPFSKTFEASLEIAILRGRQAELRKFAGLR